MKLKNLLESILLEKVYGAYAVVYHRTRVQDLADKIYTSGFKPGDGDMYGKGFYSTYELDSQMRPEMAGTYGNVVVKFAVPTTNFIFFDYEPFTKSPLAGKIRNYDESTFLFDQLNYFEMEYNRSHLLNIIDEDYSSDTALYCVKRIPSFTQKCSGIVFTGRRDGKVLLCYNPSLIIPLSYRIDGQKEFTKVTNKNLEYLKNVWKSKLSVSGKEVLGGDKAQIKQILSDLYITDYKINQDGSVDVFQDVNMRNVDNGLRIPIKFGKVEGDFKIPGMRDLQTLEGCPHTVTGDFECQYTSITSLEGGPQIVGGDYACTYNSKLVSLKGCPSQINRTFECTRNALQDLTGGPSIVKGGYYCNNNQLTSLKGSPKIIGNDFNCSFNKNLKSLKGGPSIVKGSMLCVFTKLESLDGAPKLVRKEFAVAIQENGKTFTEEEVRAVTKVGEKVIVDKKK